MKKVWKKRKEAVSPVIATIIMVAITVVLAAVLYVSIIGYSGSQNGYAPTISMTYRKVAIDSYSFTVAAVSKNDVRWSEILGICNPDGSIALPGTTYVGAGDVITISGLQAGITYAITLKYTPSGSACYQMSMTAF
jgi:flagellin-like protein